MRTSILFISLCSIVFLISSIGFAQTHFTAKLTGEQENPAVTTSATGTGAFVLTDAGLAFTVTVEGLEFTAAHFHNAAVGVNGGVVRAITDDFDGKTASGVWASTDGQPLTDVLIAELLAGNIYVNIHTAANGGGEIRGQVNLSAGTGFSANLTGDPPECWRTTRRRKRWPSYCMNRAGESRSCHQRAGSSSRWAGDTRAAFPIWTST